MTSMKQPTTALIVVVCLASFGYSQIFRDPYPFKVVPTTPIKSTNPTYTTSSSLFNQGVWGYMNGINYQVSGHQYDLFITGIPNDPVSEEMKVVLIGVHQSTGATFVKQQVLNSNFKFKSTQLFLEQSDNSLIVFERATFWSSRFWMYKIDYNPQNSNFATTEYELVLGLAFTWDNIKAFLKMGADSALVLN